MMLHKTSEQKKSRLVTQLSSILHDDWRVPRKQEDGTFKSRTKKTKDNTWSEKHGTNEVDIANTDYVNLPKDWKSEYIISAEVAMDEIYKAIENGQELNDGFVEQASEVIHIKWLERNGSWAPAEQNKPYAKLSDKEKGKDRVIIKRAVEIFHSAK